LLAVGTTLTKFVIALVHDDAINHLMSFHCRDGSMVDMRKALMPQIYNTYALCLCGLRYTRPMYFLSHSTIVKEYITLYFVLPKLRSFFSGFWFALLSSTYVKSPVRY